MKDSDRPDPDDDPLERVRELIAQRGPRSSTTPPPEDDPGRRTLYVGIAIGIALALIIPGVVVAFEDTVPLAFSAPPPDAAIDEESTIYLSADDAAYMSRVFGDTSHEIAYCGRIRMNEDEPRLDIWLADIVSSSPEQVEFVASNCPDATHEVLIHTHPNGVVGLSEQDRRTLASQPAAFACVQGGPLDADPGNRVENLGCYREVESDSGQPAVVEIPVRITA